MRRTKTILVAVLAQRYLQAAHDELEAKEAAQPRSQRRRSTDQPLATSLLPSISLSTALHAVLLMLVLTFAALASIWCYVLLNSALVAGRIVAIPTGVIFFASLSYASACYLGVLESTSNGYTTPDDALSGGWQDWFWTLPSTAGMLAIAAVIGYGINFLFPLHTFNVIAVCVWLVFPLLQLSTLENASPLAPLSLPILRTLVTRPIAWFLFYVNSFVMLALLVLIGTASWRDPPFITILIMGPITTIALLFYAWLLGILARWLTVRSESP